MKSLRYLSLALGIGAALPGIGPRDALAQITLEIIPLRHRPVEQVIPVLRPLLESGGAISGQGYQLVVRTSPRNLRDLKATLAAIDLPQRRLEIWVRFGDSAERSRASLPGARVGEPRASEIRSSLGERVDQRIQVLDGARAFIASGYTRPIRQSAISTGPLGTTVADNTVFQQLATGFDVVPRVTGERVMLEISPRRDTPPSGAPGSVESFQAASSVSARLGEWIELGASGENLARTEGGVVSTAGARGSEDRRIWLKVEELR